MAKYWDSFLSYCNLCGLRSYSPRQRMWLLVRGNFCSQWTSHDYTFMITSPLVFFFFFNFLKLLAIYKENLMSSHNFQLITYYLLQVIYSSYPFNWLRYSWNTSLNICPHGLFVQIRQVITQSRQVISQIG